MKTHKANGQIHWIHIASLTATVFMLWGAHSYAQTTILSETFEGNFPSDNGWSVGDSNSSGTAAYWDDVYSTFGGEGTHGGSWKAYCAAIGNAGTSSSPAYQDYMRAYMSKSINLSGFGTAELRFWYKIPSIETGVDALRVYMDSTLLWEKSSAQTTWAEAVVSLNSFVGASHTLKFEFYSDYSLTAEGAYLDDIVVRGWPPPSADLALQNLAVTRPVDTSARTFTACSFDIRNNGPVALAAETILVEYYLSTDTTFGNADDCKIGDTSFGGISVSSGGTYHIDLSNTGLTNMSRQWTACLVPNGSYYVFAKVSVPDGSPSDPTAGNNYNRTAATFRYASGVEGIVSIGDIVFYSWSVIGPSNVAGRFDAVLHNRENCNAYQIVVVGLRDGSGSWVSGTEPKVVWSGIPQCDCDGTSYNDLNFSIPTKSVTSAQTWYVWIEDVYATDIATAIGIFKSRVSTANDADSYRLGAVTVNPQCNFSVWPVNWSAPANGGGTTANITTGAGCSWTVSNPCSSWVQVSSTSGSGSGSVTITASANNTGSQRSCTLTIAGQSFSITQLPQSCSYAISPSSWTAPAGGGQTTVAVTATPSGCSWTVSNPCSSWVQVSSTSGSGSGSVTITASANNTGSQRSCTLTIAGYSVTVNQPPPTTGDAIRMLPACGYVAGSPNTVAIVVAPRSGTYSYAVEDSPPTGWSVSSITHNGQWDSTNGKVKWGPFFDDSSRTLTYSVTPPSGTSGLRCFSGISSFDGASVEVGGSNCVDRCTILAHPADSNGNMRMEINEVTAYGATWKQGNCSAGPCPIPIDYVTRAGYLWKNGESYHYDPSQTPPVCWMSGAAVSIPVIPPLSASGAIASVPDNESVLGIRPFGIGESEPKFNSEAPSTTRTIVGTNITVAANPATAVSSYAVEEVLPSGVTPSNIGQGGQWDASNHKVKWGPFFDNTPRVLSYSACGSGVVSGVGSFDGLSVTTTGQSSLTECAGPPVPSSTLARTTVGTNITVAANPATAVSSYAVEEVLPSGVTPSNIGQGGQWDASNHKVKWGPFFDNTPRVLSYSACGSGVVSGVGSFDGLSVTTTGQSSLTECQVTGMLPVLTEGTPATTNSFNTLTYRQTGLIEAVVRVTNPGGSAQPALVLWVRDLPASVMVYNATGSSNGVPYLKHNFPLAPGASVDLHIEYLVADRRTVPNPTYVAEWATADAPFNPQGTPAPVDRALRWTNGYFLVDYSTVSNAMYYVQYSADLTNWRTALPGRIGSGSRMQWLDNGPPKTESPPAEVTNRFYRVIRVP